MKFCRYVDDIADKNNRFKKSKLKKIKYNLNSKNKNYKLLKINTLIYKNIINKHYLSQLIDGVSLDTSKKVRIKNNKELISYAYSVAGTVGIMMSSILNINNNIARKYAVDLGIAFQLTNIARDILEDAKINRIYIPYTWYSLTTKEIKN